MPPPSKDDLIKGWRYSATIQMRTPLRVLRRHGQVVKTSQPPVETEIQHGIWVPVLKMFADLAVAMPEINFGRTMASEVGYIPEDGGEYLQFLLAVREVVEFPGAVSDRLASLRTELAKPEWGEFISKLGGQEAVYARFFPALIETIPGLPAGTVAALWASELTTPRALAECSDARLSAIKGIGPAKLKAIREACGAAPDQDSERLDLVQR